MDELDEVIILQLRGLVADTGEFIAGVICDDLTDAKQISFAHRLVDAAEAIKDRVTPPQVVEGSVIDGRTDAARNFPSSGS